MGLKSALTALINGFTDGGLNTASEFRTFQNSFRDATFGTPEYFVAAGLSAPEWLDDFSAQFPLYDAVVTKSGNHVKMSGRFANRSGSTVFGKKMFRFIEGSDKQYLPDDTLGLAGQPHLYKGKAWLPSNPSNEVVFYIGKQTGGEYVFYIEGSFPFNTSTGLSSYYLFEITYISKY